MIHIVQPDVVAHRGASAHRAEHTVAAYALAVEQGADGLECDVRLSRDGHLVCVHDRTVNRTSTGRGVVSTLTLERLSELDYGSWHPGLPESADDHVLRTPDDSERGVLTLESLLDLVKESPGVRLFVETKHPVRYGGLVEHKLVALLARHGLAAPDDPRDSQVFMMSFAPAAVRRFKETAPRVPTVLLFSRFTGTRRGGVLPPWADLAGPDVRLLREDPGFVSRAAALGRDTYCWTVDAPADIDLCRSAGVRYLATNSPGGTRLHLADPDAAHFGSVTG